MRRPSFVALVVILLAGCRERPLPAAPPPAPPAAPAFTLLERLQAEAEARPGGKPAAEEVRAALETQGFPVERWKQVLAAPVGARFCMAGQTAGGVGVAVCEYASPAE